MALLSTWVKTLQIRSKFMALLAVQIALLATITVVGWIALQGTQAEVAVLGQAQTKSRMLSMLLNDTNVLRAVHISMIAASHNGPYLEKRSTRLKETEARISASWPKLAALTWPEDEQTLLTQGSAGMKRYMEGFPALMVRAKANPKPDADPDLMEGNVQDQRQGREAFEKLFNKLQDDATQASVRAQALENRVKVTMTAGLALAISLGLGMTLAVSRQIGTAVKAIEAAMAAASQGDFTRLPKVDSGDELGEIAHHLSTLLGSLKDDIRAIAAISEQAASGATELAATADQLSSTTADISRSAEQQRQAMSHSNQVLNQVLGSLNQTQAAVVQAGTLSEQSLGLSRQGLDRSESSSQAMAAIEDSSSRVGRITSVIADIARQTNLLSLNAAIEAAKAGAQGKGFAVVAEEIRKLAERSGTAAKEIASLINESSMRVEEGSSSTLGVREVLIAIEDNIKGGAEGMRQIQAAMAQQAQDSTDVAAAVATTSTLTEHNASATTQLASTLVETARTIESLAELSHNLQNLTLKFKLG